MKYKHHGQGHDDDEYHMCHQQVENAHKSCYKSYMHQWLPRQYMVHRIVIYPLILWTDQPIIKETIQPLEVENNSSVFKSIQKNLSACEI